MVQYINPNIWQTANNSTLIKLRYEREKKKNKPPEYTNRERKMAETSEKDTNTTIMWTISPTIKPRKTQITG